MRKTIGALAAVACAMLLPATTAEARAHGNSPAAAADRHMCDPIDPSLCLLPWPNDFFTRPDRSTATGLALERRPAATPRNAAGATDRHDRLEPA